MWDRNWGDESTLRATVRNRPGFGFPSRKPGTRLRDSALPEHSGRRYHATMRLRHRVLLSAIGIGGMLLPTTARAHDGLLRSVPAAGARLTTPPASIELVFGARVDLSGMLVELADATGASIALAPPTRSPNGRIIRVLISAAMGPGSYTIRWRIVGRDGHPVRGDIAFSVVGPALAAALSTSTDAVTSDKAADDDVRASSGASTTAALVPDSLHAHREPMTTAALRADTNPLTTTPPPDATPKVFDASSPAFVAARWLTLLGLISTIGAVAYRMLVLPRAGPADVLDSSARAARVGLAAAGVLILGNVARFVAQGEALDGVSVAISSLGDSSWGTAWLVQMAGAVVAIAGFAYAAQGSAGWTVAGVGGVITALGLAMSGHSAASAKPGISIVADTLHILGGSGWLGSLGAMFVTALRRKPSLEGDDRERAVARVVTAFSPLALGFAGLAAATGVVLALFQLTSVAALFSTNWGRVLILKLALVAATAAIGAWNWKRVGPRLGMAGASGQLGRSARAELVTGALVLLASAILVGLPTPH